jgi:hypothetical protein
MITAAARKTFESDGFLKAGPFLDQRDLELLAQRLDCVFEDPKRLGSGKTYDIGETGSGGQQSVAVMHQPSIEQPSLITSRAFQVCREAASELLDGEAHYLYDYSIYKRAATGGATPWHQDQAYRGHEEDTHALHFWLPLQPVSSATGCMFFIPGSHHLGLVPHHPDVSVEGSKALVADNVDESTARPIAMQAGEILVFHPLALHYSSPNSSPGLRRTWILHFGPHAEVDPVTRLPKKARGS